MKVPPSLTITLRLSSDAPKTESAGLWGHQDTSVPQLSASSSVLQEQEAVHRGRHSGWWPVERKLLTGNHFVKLPRCCVAHPPCRWSSGPCVSSLQITTSPSWLAVAMTPREEHWHRVRISDLWTLLDFHDMSALTYKSYKCTEKSLSVKLFLRSLHYESYKLWNYTNNMLHEIQINCFKGISSKKKLCKKKEKSHYDVSRLLF